MLFFSVCLFISTESQISPTQAVKLSSFYFIFLLIVVSKLCIFLSHNLSPLMFFLFFLQTSQIQREKEQASLSKEMNEARLRELAEQVEKSTKSLGSLQEKVLDDQALSHQITIEQIKAREEKVKDQERRLLEDSKQNQQLLATMESMKLQQERESVSTTSGIKFHLIFFLLHSTLLLFFSFYFFCVRVSVSIYLLTHVVIWFPSFEHRLVSVKS